MHMLIPISPSKLIPKLPSTIASVSRSKLFAVALIVALDVIICSAVYPLVTAA